MNFELLPQDCISHILSCTSPRDACRSGLVSTTVRHAGDSDSVWEKFLPSDYQEILSRLVSPLVFASKKELYSKLCRPLLIDEGRKSFSISKTTGEKGYTLSARNLSITWSSNALYWSWKPLLQSRFAETVELRTICWLEIQGKISTCMLSPKTTYRAYLIVKFADRAYGLDALPSEVSVVVGKHQSQGIAYLRRPESNRPTLERVCFLNRIEALRSKVSKGEERVPHEREDGWFEVELGEFYNDGGDEEVKMSLREVKGVHLKGGLIVEGIEIRPKD
ncbi:hypothetical protein VitviT2T_020910 [Vitis vinifera]|uniref:F-box domain-containing protein n=2 Tax=Vitis vinifera TaxID=29760 RepID=A0ABY9D7Y9_VITVI|nr:F-box protein PP2-B15 isoform X1 [Vitis vinifera]WKA02756.1 hypothetical protein VitviT2T_020910 [Vitis vinifera]|eukprot:XP_002279225.1 PREDICTED: F-box protein PP2-B15 [Vitis vinifera]